MKKMRLDSLAFWLLVHPEEEAIRLAFENIDNSREHVEEILGRSLEKVDVILFEGKEYPRPK